MSDVTFQTEIENRVVTHITLTKTISPELRPSLRVSFDLCLESLTAINSIVGEEKLSCFLGQKIINEIYHQKPLIVNRITGVSVPKIDDDRRRKFLEILDRISA